MTASSLVKEVTGVVGCVVGDVDGNVLEYGSSVAASEIQVGAAAFTSKQLEQVGEALGVGQAKSFSVAGASTTWVVAIGKGYVFSVLCDGIRSATSVENALATTDWASAVESPLEDEDVEEVVPDPVTERPKPAAATRAPPPKPEPKSTSVPRPSPPQRAMLPKVPPITARTAPPRPSARPQDNGPQGHTDTLLTELRRMLIKGQLKQAEAVSAKLIADAQVRGVPLDGFGLPTQLLEGIAMVLAGDALGALASLKLISASTHSSSIAWVSLIWCARSSAVAGAGSEATKNFAHAALALAAQLDTEARAISTFELANAAYHQGNMAEALQLVRNARKSFSTNADSQLSSGCWLLEARVLAAQGSHDESVHAARRAREERPSWPAPATFIARRALRDGLLSEADHVLEPLLKADSVATDVERAHRIVGYVRAGTVPAQAACEFLELVEAPPTSDNIRKLTQLSETYPRVEDFRDALGWQLLRTGQYESASAVFEQLSATNDISADVRSSVLLALGWLAAAASRNAKPAVRVRAAVDATPKGFISTKPSLPSSGSMRTAAPVEFRSSDGPTPANTAGAVRDRTPSAATGSRPVFSGNLQLFALPDLLEFLRSGQRTGTLLCSSSAGIGAIHLRRGYITGAASPKTKGLRDYLLAMGVVTRTTLQEVDQESDGERALIGGLLTKLGAVTVDQVRHALHDQVRDAVKELMSWGTGQFAFDPEALVEPSVSDVAVEFDPQAVLLNIYKEIDEKSPGG